MGMDYSEITKMADKRHGEEKKEGDSSGKRKKKRKQRTVGKGKAKGVKRRS